MLIIAILSSCQKDEVASINNDCEELLYFDSMKQVLSELNRVIHMSDEEKEKWEESNGVKSFVLEAKRFYETIDPEAFSSIDEVKQFVANNSNFLILVEDGNGEYELDTRLSSNSFAIFANLDGLFQVDDKIFKVYENAVLSVDVQELEILKASSYNEALTFSTVVTSKISMMKSTESVCSGTSVRSDNGGERIRLQVDAYNIFCNDCISLYGITDLIQVIAYFEARPYNRVLGIWYRCKRTISCSIKLNFDYKNSDGEDSWTNYDYEYSNSGTNDYVITEEKLVASHNATVNSSPVFYGPIYDININSYDCWAKQANTNKAYAKCPE